ncbi:adhesion G-protein coupled receptor D1-like [Actinia tenebrosa]|uniref:Adhesion G-protein coupled receptor D1-like n=1 Tax=Actinia tenebrosa TaxID=6105 RepID=A0A6P8HUA1_ACTTE|nr:adhesion G-protein coupled receptor D1-like [Actinia tenebrosa]
MSSPPISPEGSESNQSQPLDNNLVSIYIQKIAKLDIKQNSSLEESVDMMQNILVAMGTSSTNSTNQMPLLASQKLEEFALRYLEYNSNKKEIVIKKSNVVLHAKIVLPGTTSYEFETDDGIQEQNTKIFLPKENFVENGTAVLSIYYNNLEDILNKQEYIYTSNKYGVRSKILSTSIQPKKNKLVKNATIGFKIPVSDPIPEKKCVFWEFATEKVKDPGWSSEGCTLVKSTDQYVECSCNHLTHFAVLMQVKDDQLSSEHQDILEILTYLGLTLSIIGCILTFMTYFLFTDVKSEQSQIRMNLVFVLAVAHILFLLASPARGDLFLCISVAALMQLFYTSALCWMSAEGIQLYMQVVKVFNTNLKMRQVYGFAWGFPLLLMVVSLSIASNGHGGLASFVNEEFCWLSTKNHLIWTFIAPVLLLILGNIIVLGLVMKEMKNITKPMGTGQRANALRSSFKAFVVLAPLLGITWIMGLLCILGAGAAGLYIFTILNSIQGFFIFLFHCVRNSEIRSKLQRKIQAFDDSHLKQESSNNYRRSKNLNQINSKTPNKPTTPETAVVNTLNIPQENMALSELDISDNLHGQTQNELKL